MSLEAWVTSNQYDLFKSHLRATWKSQVSSLMAAYSYIPNIGTIIYIDPTVSGPGSGTLVDPYKVPPSINAANTYLFAEGTTYIGSLQFSTGSSGAVVGTYTRGSGARVIDKQRLAAINGNGVQNVISKAAGVNNVTISGLRVYGASHTSQPRGFYSGYTSGSGVVIEHCIFEENEYGLGTGNLSAQIQLFTDNNVIRFNRIISKHPDCIWIGEVSPGYGAKNTAIYGNELILLPGATYDGADGIQMSSSTGFGNLNIYNNWIEQGSNTKQCIIAVDSSGGSTGTIDCCVFGNCLFGFDLSSSKLGTNHAKSLLIQVQNARVLSNYVENGEHSINVSGPANVIGNLVVQKISNPISAVNLRGIIVGANSFVNSNTFIAWDNNASTVSGSIGIEAQTGTNTVDRNIIVGTIGAGVKISGNETNNLFDLTSGYSSAVLNSLGVPIGMGSGSTMQTSDVSITSPVFISDNDDFSMLQNFMDVLGNEWRGRRGAVQRLVF